MFTINTYEYECTKKCKHLEHGKVITSSITKRSIEDSKLVAFIAKTCRNFSEILDAEGRSALHLAASVNRYAIAEWLLNQGANINIKDYESSHTPLHRAIYYGNISIAILLLRYGAVSDIIDSDYKTPLQCCCNPRKYNKTGSREKELLVWGSNKNYNLGVGNEQSKNTPQSIEELRKNNIFIEQVSIATYHSLFLSNKNEVYAVGHGKGGRLGIGVEHTLVSAKKLNINFKNAGEKVINVSAGKYHSLILTDNNNIYSTGLNSHFQLGMKTMTLEKLLEFKYISGLIKLSGKSMIGVIAHDYYSLTYSDNELYVWGTNLGQFGIKKETNPVLTIQELPVNEHKVLTFDSNNSAIACYTSTKYLYVYCKYKARSYKSPGLEVIKKLLITSDNLSPSNEINSNNTNTTAENLKILTLTESNSLYMWYEDIQKFVKCIFPMVFDLPIDKMTRCSKNVVFLSNGDLYMGTPVKFNYQKVEFGEYKETYNKKDICDTSKVKIGLKRIPNIFRAIDIFIDDNGENFAILQENAADYLNIPKRVESVPCFKTLLEETNENDAIHDLVFHVENHKFAAHKFIIYSRAPGLGNIIQIYTDKNIYLNFDKMSAYVFKAILEFIYTNNCLTMDEICSLYDNNTDRKSALNSFKHLLEKFGIMDYIIDNTKQIAKITYPNFARTNFPELYDVTINCSNNQILKCHKCILVGRLEYFSMMFNHTWSESNVINLSTIPIKFMEPIIDYLYTYDFKKLLVQNLSENFIFTMITICDQFFINEMKESLELLILERLTIKNCGDILEFANSYNCFSLEAKCIDYICMNLDRILENCSLMNLELELLNKINERYAKLFEEVEYRKITPYSDAIDDYLLESFIENFKIDFDHKMTNDGGDDRIKSKQSKIKQSRATKDRRQYERDAIILLKDLSLENIRNQHNVNKNIVNEEAKQIAEKLQSESKNWIKVQEKKELKKKSKVNEILQNEEKEKNQLTSLNLIITSKHNISIDGDNDIATKNPFIKSKSLTPTSSSRTISFGDFTPVKKEKLSQKQKKRLSSETNANAPTPTQTKLASQPETVQPQTPENVWKINKSPTAAIEIPSSGHSQNKTNDLSSSCKTPPASSSSSSFQGNGIFQIQEDEKKQKEYYEKMKTKSLMLTQLEEKAIEDLKKFYNIENVYDETITIERKSKVTMNFAIWQHQ